MIYLKEIMNNLIILFIISVLIGGCTKENQELNNLFFGEKTVLTIKTKEVVNITGSSVVFSAESGGAITGELIDVKECGIVFGTKSGVTLGQQGVYYIKSTNIAKEYTCTMSQLGPGTTYYIKAYLKTLKDTLYGEQLNFKTPGNPITLPILTTLAVNNITSNSAYSGGSITSDGGAEVTARGVCWSLNENPTINDFKTIEGTGSGNFTCQVNNLNANTVYYLRAFATNSQGTGYGNQVQCITKPNTNNAGISTLVVSNVTAISATSGGLNSSDGGAAITAKGVCWNTAPTPTIANYKTTDGSGIGNFTSNITGLTANTKYYLRAYVTNAYGTAYGNEQTFTTLAAGTAPTNGLVLYYPFNNNANDASGNNNNGAPSNCSFTGNACTFNGYDSPSQLSVTNSNSLKFTNTFTICMFIYVNSNIGMSGIGTKVSEAGQCIFAKGSDTYGLYANIALKNDNSAIINFRIKGGGTTATANISNFGTGSWHFLAFAVSNNTLKVYVDTNLSNQTSITNTDFTEANASNLSFGKFSSWYPLNGKLDEIRIYNRDLLPNELLQVYNAGH